MSARMQNPAMLLPGAMQAIQDLLAAVERGGVSPTTLGLIHLRVSQINGCVLCTTSGTCQLQSAGETDDRLRAVANWRTARCFRDGERAALALAEAATRLSDRTDPVPDAVWNEAAHQYDEQALAALVLNIGITNLFNRLNVSTGQVAAEWPTEDVPAG
jgi:AhpD family alkylhydroperoxidase